VDISKIGVGQLPGEAVTVSYSTLKLKGPDGIQQSRPEAWDRQISSTSSTTVLSYQPAGSNVNTTKTYNILQTTETLSSYIQLTKPDGEVLRLVSRRVETFTSSTAKEAGGILQQYLAAALTAESSTVTKTTTTTYTYDAEGNAVREDRVTEGALAFAAGALSVPVTFPDGSSVTINLATTVQLERVVIDTLTLGDVQQVTTTVYGPWWSQQTGQQAVAESRSSLTTAAATVAWINAVVLAGLNIVDTSIQTTRTIRPVSLPTTAEINNQAAANGGDPTNGYRIESSSELALAVGSATAQRRIELSLPYAPDDRFTKGGLTYSSSPSGAEQKALLFGRVQNRLLLGNRNGMNIQLAPELMPAAPFAPFSITAKSATAQYRTNGTSWTFDAQGMVVSTDALFWGGVGGTFANRWFPVAPGITSLPTTPAVVDGQMTVTTVVPVANETVITEGRLRLGLSVNGLAYPLTLLTEVPAISLQLPVEVAKVKLVNVPTAAATIAAAVPAVAGGASVKVPVATIAIARHVPTVVSGAGVVVPAAGISIDWLEPDQIGKPRTQVRVPAGVVALAGAVPVVVSGASVAVPAGGVTVAGLVPVISAFDADASAYITAVETADGQTLEADVRAAINAFVVGCKNDGIWTPIKSACILAGARTRAGALVALKGTAPTSFGTVGGWNYNRETGLAGNGTDNYLDSNRNNNADGQNSNHNAAYVSTAAAGVLLGAGPGTDNGTNVIVMASATTATFRNRSSTGTGVTDTYAGLVGHSRSASGSYTIRVNGADTTASVTSQTPRNENVLVFRRSGAGSPSYTQSRLAFYSIGESLDLALLDTRVDALIDAIAAAIP
jgi:YD repeat-containing protein